MRVRDYTESAYALYRDGMDADTLVSNLKQALERKGHTRLLPKVLSELLSMTKKEGKRDEVIVTLADRAHETAHADAIHDAVKKLGGRAHSTRIDPTITGGFIAEGKELRIDQSHKKQLLTIYRSLIK